MAKWKILFRMGIVFIYSSVAINFSGFWVKQPWVDYCWASFLLGGFIIAWISAMILTEHGYKAPAMQ